MATRNLTLRLLTAAVAVPPLLYLLFRGPAWGFFALVLVAAALGARELFLMTHPGDAVSRGIGIVQTLVVVAAFYFHGRDPRLLPTALLVVTAVGALMPLFRLGEMSSAALRLMAGMGGPLYVGAGLGILARLRYEFGASGAGWVLLTLTFGWLADTGGYFFGRFLGKTPLYPAVSPKKTRAGLVGALVGASLGALAASLWYLPELDLLHAVPLALAAGVLGQLGDLSESLLKRSTGIKDSGSLVPGHGGILDRVDALLFVAPLVYLYATWCGPY